MSTKNKWLLGFGIILGLSVLFALPFAWQALFHAQRYGLTGYGQMPMMRSPGFSHMGGDMGLGMFIAGLIPLGLIILMGLGIAALIKYLRTPRV
ncbi:MAG: hypothetical protein K8S20_11730 [Chloroflexi bacterium]|nr:hypothetical protein [Chloroflexota bacterium]